MFIRQIHVTKNGKRRGYWALVESYRTKRGPRQRIVSYLGQIDACCRLGIQYAAQGKSWHQKQQRVEAHILVCFLSYVLWKTLGQMCRDSGLGDEPRRVLEELSRIKSVDVVMPTRCGIEIRRRCVSQPTVHQAVLLQYLGIQLAQIYSHNKKKRTKCSENLRLF